MANVLVVDDEPDILLLHRLNLEMAGHVVLLAADGVKALERVDADHPDVIVLDVQMPVLDGWSVLERLQAHPSSPPVLIVSAFCTREDIEKASGLGAAGFLAKPLDYEVLIDTVQDLLNRV